MDSEPQQGKTGMGKSTMLIVIVAFVVLVVVAFLVIRPGGSGTSSGINNKPNAPAVAH